MYIYICIDMYIYIYIILIWYVHRPRVEAFESFKGPDMYNIWEAAFLVLWEV